MAFIYNNMVINADTGPAMDSIKEMGKAYTGAVKDMNSASKGFSAGGAQQLHGVMSGLNEATRVFNQRWTEATAGIKDTKRIVAGIMVSQSFYTLSNVMVDASAAALQFSKDMETAAISMEYFVSGADKSAKAAAYLREINIFAARTPFSTSEALSLSKYMQAMGVQMESTKSFLKVITDTAAATGATDLNLQRITFGLGQMLTKGRLANEEIRQLANANIPIYEILQEEMGLTGEQIARIGTQWVPAEKAVVAILKGLEKRYAGAADRIADTVTGMFDTLKDNSLIIVQQLGKNTYEEFANSITKVRDALDKYRDIVTEMGSAGLVRSIMLDLDASGELGRYLLTLTSNVRNLRDALGELFVAAQPLMKVLGKAAYAEIMMYSYGIQALMTSFTALLKGLETVMRSMGALGDSFELAGKGLAALFIGYKSAKALSFIGQAAMAAATGVMSFNTSLALVVPAFGRLSPGLRAATLGFSAIAAGAVLATGAIGKLGSALSGISSKNTGVLPSDYEAAYAKYEKDMEVYNDSIAKYQEAFSEPFTNISETGVDTFENISDASKKAAASVKRDWVSSFDEVYQIQKDMGSAASDLADIDPYNPYGNLPAMPFFTFPEESNAQVPDYPKMDMDDAFQDSLGEYSKLFAAAVTTGLIVALGRTYTKLFPNEELKGINKGLKSAGKAALDELADISAKLSKMNDDFAQLISKMGKDIDADAFRMRFGELETRVKLYETEKARLASPLSMVDNYKLKDFNAAEEARFLYHKAAANENLRSLRGLEDELRKLQGLVDDPNSKKLYREILSAQKTTQASLDNLVNLYEEDATRNLDDFIKQFTDVGFKDNRAASTTLLKDLEMIDRQYRELVESFADTTKSSDDIAEAFKLLKKNIAEATEYINRFKVDSGIADTITFFDKFTDRITTAVNKMNAVEKLNREIINSLATVRSVAGTGDTLDDAIKSLTAITGHTNDEIRAMREAMALGTRTQDAVLDQLLRGKDSSTVAKSNKELAALIRGLGSATPEAAYMRQVAEAMIRVDKKMATQILGEGNMGIIRRMAEHVSFIAKMSEIVPEKYFSDIATGINNMELFYKTTPVGVAGPSSELQKLISSLPDTETYKGFKQFFKQFTGLTADTQRLTKAQLEAFPQILEEVVTKFAETIDEGIYGVQKATLKETIDTLKSYFTMPVSTLNKAPADPKLAKQYAEVLAVQADLLKRINHFLEATRAELATGPVQRRFPEMNADKRTTDAALDAIAEIFEEYRAGIKTSAETNALIRAQLAYAKEGAPHPELAMQYRLIDEQLDKAFYSVNNITTSSETLNKAIKRIGSDLAQADLFTDLNKLSPELKNVSGVLEALARGKNVELALDRIMAGLVTNTASLLDFRLAVTDVAETLYSRGVLTGEVIDMFNKSATKAAESFNPLHEAMLRIADFAKANPDSPEAIKLADGKTQRLSAAEKVADILPGRNIATDVYLEDLYRNIDELYASIIEPIEKTVFDIDTYSRAVSNLPETVKSAGLFDIGKVFPSGTDQMAIQEGLSDFGKTMVTNMLNNLIKNKVIIEPNDYSKVVMQIGTEFEDLAIGIYNQISESIKLRKGTSVFDPERLMSAQIDAFSGNMPVDVKTMNVSKFEGIDFLRRGMDDVIPFEDFVKWFPEYATQFTQQAIVTGQRQIGMLAFNREALYAESDTTLAGRRRRLSGIDDTARFVDYQGLTPSQLAEKIRRDIYLALTGGGKKAFDPKTLEKHFKYITIDIPEDAMLKAIEGSAIQTAKANIISAVSKSSAIDDLFVSFLENGMAVDIARVSRQLDFSKFNWVTAVTGEKASVGGMGEDFSKNVLKNLFDNLQVGSDASDRVAANVELQNIVDQLKSELKRVGSRAGRADFNLAVGKTGDGITKVAYNLKATTENMSKVITALEKVIDDPTAIQQLPRSVQRITDAVNAINKHVGSTLVEFADTGEFKKLSNLAYMAQSELRKLSNLSLPGYNDTVKAVDEFVKNVYKIQKIVDKQGATAAKMTKELASIRVKHIDNIVKVAGGLDDFRMFLDQLTTMFEQGAFMQGKATGKAALLRSIEEIKVLDTTTDEMRKMLDVTTERIRSIKAAEIKNIYRSSATAKDMLDVSTQELEYSTDAIQTKLSQVAKSRQLLDVSDLVNIERQNLLTTIDIETELANRQLTKTGELVEVYNKTVDTLNSANRKLEPVIGPKLKGGAAADVAAEVSTALAEKETITALARIIEMFKGAVDTFGGYVRTFIDTTKRIFTENMQGAITFAADKTGKIIETTANTYRGLTDLIFTNPVVKGWSDARAATKLVETPIDIGRLIAQLSTFDLIAEGVNVGIAVNQDMKANSDMQTTFTERMWELAQTDSALMADYRTREAEWMQNRLSVDETFTEYMARQLELESYQRTNIESLNSAVGIIAQYAAAGIVAGTMVAPGPGTVAGGVVLGGIGAAQVASSIIAEATGTYTTAAAYGEALLKRWDTLTELEKTIASLDVLSEMGSTIATKDDLKNIFKGKAFSISDKVGWAKGDMSNMVGYTSPEDMRNAMYDAMFNYGALTDSTWKEFSKTNIAEQDKVFQKYFGGTVAEVGDSFNRLLPQFAEQLYQSLESQGISDRPSSWDTVTADAMPTVLNFLSEIVNKMEEQIWNSELLPSAIFDSQKFAMEGIVSSYLGPNFDTSLISSDILASLSETLGLTITQLTTDITSKIPGLDGVDLSSGALLQLNMDKLSDDIMGWTQRLPDSINIGNFSAKDLEILAQAGIMINNDGTVTFMKAANAGTSGSEREVALDPDDFSKNVLEAFKKDGIDLSFNKITGSELYSTNVVLDDVKMGKNMLTARFALGEYVGGDYSDFNKEQLKNLGNTTDGNFFEITNQAVLSGDITIEDWLKKSGIEADLNDDVIRVLKQIDERISIEAGENGLGKTRETIANAADGIVITLNQSIDKITAEQKKAFAESGIVIEEVGGQTVAIISQLGEDMKEGVTYLAEDVWNDLSPAAVAALETLGVKTKNTAGLVMVDITEVMNKGTNDIVDLFIKQPDLWDQIPLALRSVIAERSGIEVKNGMLVLQTDLMNGMVNIQDAWYQSWDKLDPKVKSTLAAGLVTSKDGMMQMQKVTSEEAAKVVDGVVYEFKDLPDDMQEQLLLTDAAAREGFYVIRDTTKDSFLGVMEAVNQAMIGSKTILEATLSDIALAISKGILQAQGYQNILSNLDGGSFWKGTGPEKMSRTVVVNNITYFEIIDSKTGRVLRYDYIDQWGQTKTTTSLPKTTTTIVPRTSGSGGRFTENAFGGIIEHDGIYRAGEFGFREAIVPLERKSPLREIGKAVGMNMPALGFELSPDLKDSLVRALNMTNAGIMKASAQQSMVQQPSMGGIVQQVIEAILPAITNNDMQPTPVYVGTLIADDRGIRELEKKLYDVRRVENLRRGI